jgi:hypothetical protein
MIEREGRIIQETALVSRLAYVGSPETKRKRVHCQNQAGKQEKANWRCSAGAAVTRLT